MSTLSKSKILAYRQCPRRLWLEVNRPDVCVNSSDTQARFRTGHRVGAMAQQIYDPQNKGTLIDMKALGVNGALSKTQELLAKRYPIFEAGFEVNNVRAFADVLRPVRKGDQRLWRMIEIKSTTSVKPYQHDDAAVQSWIARRAGLPLAGISVAYIDSDWTYNSDGDYSGFLKMEDLTDDALARSAEVEKWIVGAQKILKQKKEPTTRPDCHCTTPYRCGFIDHCNRQTPQATYPVEWLPSIQTNALKDHIKSNSVTDMSQVPDALLNDSQKRVKRCTMSGKRYFDQAGAMMDLASHTFPAYFLDFETVNLAVPRWKGARPYQHVPFQFSRHRLDAQSRLTHKAFIDLSGDDPSLAFTEALLNACNKRGPIFIYTPFEKTIIKKLIERFPQHASALEALIKRLVDLQPVVKARYYHPDQQGSWSIKAILPTIAPDLDYGQLTGVQDGSMAMEAYQEAIAPNTTDAQRKVIQQQLLDYCKLDTDALVRLRNVLSGTPRP